LSEIGKDAVSYKGRDEFSVVENRLVRRFPVAPRNGVQHYRQIQYKLVAGEAGWMLKVDRVEGLIASKVFSGWCSGFAISIDELNSDNLFLTWW